MQMRDKAFVTLPCTNTCSCLHFTRVAQGALFARGEPLPSSSRGSPAEEHGRPDLALRRQGHMHVKGLFFLSFSLTDIFELRLPSAFCLVTSWSGIADILHIPRCLWDLHVYVFTDIKQRLEIGNLFACRILQGLFSHALSLWAGGNGYLAKAVHARTGIT